MISLILFINKIVIRQIDYESIRINQENQVETMFCTSPTADNWSGIYMLSSGRKSQIKGTVLSTFLKIDIIGSERSGHIF
jgi:hypothetical protein